MRARVLVALLAGVAPLGAIGGDDASGPIKYQANLGAPFETYQVTADDKRWGETLAGRLHYSGTIVYFGRTTLSLSVNGRPVEGAIYQRLDKPEYFYVV